jgi:hypothetical protein
MAANVLQRYDGARGRHLGPTFHRTRQKKHSSRRELLHVEAELDEARN